MSNFIVEDLKRIVKGDNPLTKIILASVIIFLVDNLVGRYFGMGNWLGLPGSFGEFIFKPWTIITYMFMHGGFMHVLFNMLWLYWMGQLIIEYLNKDRFVAIYFLGGIVGGLTYLLLYNAMELTGNGTMGAGLIGASAGVMAIVIAAATLLPNFEVQLFLIGRLPLKYVGLGILIITSLLDFTNNMGGKVAHLGGALVGYLFVKQLQSGTDWSKFFTALYSPILGLFKSKPKMRVVKNQRAKTTQKTRTQQEPRVNDQARIDAILDKISSSGYDALTEEEKRILFRASKNK
jgi:membrane associated rhomboid family serine protease